MDVRPDCLPCILKQLLRTARGATENEWLHRRVMKAALDDLRDADEAGSPAELLSAALRSALRTLGEPDPFASARADLSRRLGPVVEELRARIGEAERPLCAAALAAAAANVVDELALRDFDPGEVILTLFETGFGLADQGRFEREIEGASRILFLHDNAGEAAIDQLLISELRSLDKDVDVVVRGAGLFHDATRDDVPPTGLIIETESEVMGAPPVLCSTLFNEALERADLVIAKGSASWQTLPPSLPLVTLLTPKCEVMAAALGIKSGRPAMVFADG